MTYNSKCFNHIVDHVAGICLLKASLSGDDNLDGVKSAHQSQLSNWWKSSLWDYLETQKP